MSCRLINVKFKNLEGTAAGYYDLVDSQNIVVFENLNSNDLINGLTFSVNSNETQFTLTNYRVFPDSNPCLGTFTAAYQTLNQSTNQNSIFIPGDSQAGDIAILSVFGVRSGTTAFPASSLTGWTNIINNNLESSTFDRGSRSEIWIKILSSGDPGLNLTGFGTAGASNLIRRKDILVFRGSSTIKSFNSTGVVFTSNYAAGPPQQTITNNYDGATNVCIYWGYFANSNFTNTSGQLSVFDNFSSGNYTKFYHKTYNGNPAASLTISKGNDGEYNFQSGGVIRLNF